MAVQISYSVSPGVAKNSKPASVPEKLQQALGLHQQGQTTHAQAIYLEILRIEPNHSEALHLLGLVAAQDGKPQVAAELMRKAIESDPRNVAAYCNRATVLKSLGQLSAALASYDHAIGIAPDLGAAYFNRGSVLQELKQLDAALASYDRAIAINVDFAEAHCGRGGVLMEFGQWDAALISLNQAIAIEPDLAEAHLLRSMTLLLLGDYRSGWQEYEWRWNVETSRTFKEKRSFQQPLWLGQESIAGKSVLLYMEQGFGDAIQFCRYTKMVAAIGARVILEVQEPLAVLLSDLDGVSHLVTRGSTLPGFDYQCPLLSLPLAFKTTVDSIPSPSRYLVGDAIKVARWQRKLAGLVDKTRPLIGLVWSGRPTHEKDHNRSIQFAELIRHLPRNCQYITLQKEIRELDRSALESNPHIFNFSSDLTDFSDTAALCECLDLVISVDTSVAHLSGALGKRTWILLPFSPDWRWLLDREDSSPWYSQVKLYRQKQIGDWNEVLNQVSIDLVQTFNVVK